MREESSFVFGLRPAAGQGFSGAGCINIKQGVKAKGSSPARAMSRSVVCGGNFFPASLQKADTTPLCWTACLLLCALRRKLLLVACMLPSRTRLRDPRGVLVTVTLEEQPC